MCNERQQVFNSHSAHMIFLHTPLKKLIKKSINLLLQQQTNVMF